MNAKGRVHKFGDNVDTDVIIPARYLNTASHKELAAHCMEDIDAEFVNKVNEGDIMVAEKNFGCGSSREHAALAPLYLGVKAVLVKSFARIHRANLINAGILPLTFVNEADYDKINQGDQLVLADVRKAVAEGKSELTVVNKTNGAEIPVLCELSGRTKDIMLAGGLLDFTRESMK